MGYSSTLEFASGDGSAPPFFFLFFSLYKKPAGTMTHRRSLRLDDDNYT